MQRHNGYIHFSEERVVNVRLMEPGKRYLIASTKRASLPILEHKIGKLAAQKGTLSAIGDPAVANVLQLQKNAPALPVGQHVDENRGDNALNGTYNGRIKLEAEDSGDSYNC